ncbi:MAG: hypothetical protein QXO75_11380, partial [Nitrososphaerota archaeon]
LLAKPSGETLTISSGSLLGRGIQDLDLLNVVYPNGETSTILYTGGGLQIPTLSYSSGAFVGVQAIETNVVWTSIGQKEFYGQILSTSPLIESVFGKSFSEEFVKILLLSGLIDTQVLDIANELVKNVEWLKGFSEEKRIELAKKIAEYVKKGETAEEAIERARKESEEYIRGVENAIYAFCDSISDTKLAGEVRDFLKHVLNIMGPDDARWLLNLLENVYARGGNDKLRSVVEKVFRYPESKTHGCALSSTKIAQLMKLEESALMVLLEKTLESEGGEIVVDRFERTISESGYISHSGSFEEGLYLVRVIRKEDGKMFEWSTEKRETSNRLSFRVPERFKNELIGKEVEIIILRYDYSLHFKCEGLNFFFSPRTGLIIEGRQIELESVAPRSWGIIHGASMEIKLKERSITGAEIYFVFFEDGEFRVTFTVTGTRGATLSIEGNLLIIEYDSNEAIVPIVVKEWRVEEEYKLNIPAEGEIAISLIKELRKIFGYYNVEELRSQLEEGEVVLVAYFDNGRYAYCGIGNLHIRVPEGAKVLEYIVFWPHKSEGLKLSDVEIEMIKKANDRQLGDFGRNKLASALENGEVLEIGDVKAVYTEVPIGDTGKHVDIVVETNDGHFIVIEAETTRNSDLDTIAKRSGDGAGQLENYRKLIKEYGLDLSGRSKKEPVKNVDAYWVYVLYPDFENKVMRLVPRKLSEGG